MSSSVPDPQRPGESPPGTLVRPAPALSRWARLAAAAGSAKARLQPGDQSGVASAGVHAVPVHAVPEDADAKQPLAVIALSAVGAALLAAGVLWGWQLWTDRSARPVDELLPRLVVADESGVPVTALPPTATPLASAIGTAPPVDGPQPDVAQPNAAVSEPPQLLVVHVAGAVREPGVVELSSGSRVFHAVEAVGGIVDNADLDRVNLAAPVHDGERLWVPAVGESAPPPVAASERPTALVLAPTQSSLPLAERFADRLPVDLNLASRTDLETLPGIGPALAQAIVTTRAERGPFRSVDELLEVAGIGPATLERLRSLIVVQPPSLGG